MKKNFIYSVFVTLLCLLLTVSIIIKNNFIVYGIFIFFFALYSYERFRLAMLKIMMFISLLFLISLSTMIVLSLFFKTIVFFKAFSFLDFFTGLKWLPYPTLDKYNHIVYCFGVLPLFFGTIFVSVIAILVATPISLMSSLYITYYLSKKVKNSIKVIINIMSGIPTVIYGYFSVIHIAPFLNKVFLILGFSVHSENAMVAGVTIGIMIIPLLISLFNDIILSVPKSISYGALALGSTKSEAFFRVILPYCFSGLFSATILGLARAIGETMIVLMVTGVTANMSLSPFTQITTMTVQITTLLTGDQSFQSPETNSAYALAFTLFLITWILNALALKTIYKYQKKF